eukprot:CAMPEP_0113954986 /NCGR_PEP_ID=MMETSP0011_2-20120614/989_1 /TAXON_ID=101924 /ORGANISM="Rhodosorus marinus" /LENGTH=81 /DNA_ID=CAMNT_0000964439 /DNA_START=1024 /DNA_END=1266 /DNA_ORIENTATION=- /assembly_acc=CAM_ASM_000156
MTSGAPTGLVSPPDKHKGHYSGSQTALMSNIYHDKVAQSDAHPGSSLSLWKALVTRKSRGWSGCGNVLLSILLHTWNFYGA